MLRSIAGIFLVAALALSSAHAEPIRVVAAESVYGQICSAIGGDAVAVTSILSKPEQDPHAVEPGAATAREIARARLVVYNGAGYDPWFTKLLAASHAPSREAIEVAALAGRKAGDNPHLWYDTRAMSALAQAVATALSRIDPAHAADYAKRRAAFDASLRPLLERIAAMRARYAGAPITATEPVFDYMADALGLEMRNRRFQLALMNGSEPSARDMAAFERDLRKRGVRALIYNRQTGGPLADRLRSIATSSVVPVVGVTETQPHGTSYPEWMLSQLDALERALAGR